MKKLFIVLCFLLFLHGCKGDKEELGEELGIDATTFFHNMASAPVSIIPRNSLPQWLNEKIDKYEEYNEAVGWVRIFKGEWKARIVYFIHDWLDSCLLCAIFYDDGENIVLENIDPSFDDFRTTSKGWVLVYQLGNEVFTKGGSDSDSRITDTYVFPFIQRTPE